MTDSEDSHKPNSDIPSSDSIKIKKSTYGNMIKGLVAAIAIAAFVGGYSISEINNSDSISKDDLQELVDALEASNQNQPTSRESTPPQPSILRTVSLDDDPMKGNPNAPVTIVEFSDFQCPFCSRFFEQTLPLIEQNYINTGKVNLVYRDYPLSFHQNAKPAHIASECADEQDAFWGYHDILFEKQIEWQSIGFDIVNKQFLAYAQELGLDESTFSSCFESNEIEQEIQSDFQDGAKYGVTGTPTFFVGNEKYGYTKITGAQPYQNFVNVIESKLR